MTETEPKRTETPTEHPAKSRVARAVRVVEIVVRMVRTGLRLVEAFQSWR